MVQWKITLNERKLILETHPFSTSMIMGGREIINNWHNNKKLSTVFNISESHLDIFLVLYLYCVHVLSEVALVLEDQNPLQREDLEILMVNMNGSQQSFRSWEWTFSRDSSYKWAISSDRRVMADRFAIDLGANVKSCCWVSRPEVNENIVYVSKLLMAYWLHRI